MLVIGGAGDVVKFNAVKIESKKDNAKTKDKIPNAAQRFDSIRCDSVLTLSIGRGKEQRGRARLQRVFVDSIMDEARYYRFFVRTTIALRIRIASSSNSP